MALIYVLAGINHFFHPAFYLSIIPKILPYPLFLVYLSGAFETVLGLLLFPKKTRRTAAWGIILLLLAVFPANIQMSLTYYQNNHPDFWITLLRLPLQFILIYWAYTYTGPPSK